ncbi:YveK family protein [Lentibacillus sediminis]|uniref:YveK family protein n=1 Tax=Lentibacillus sediminis TaxID=1940529 RepID=UPI000C1BBAE7|nr:Wzz/FepE/Etk N-terminal domain-containing protein [Lentibacillus sediminis]
MEETISLKEIFEVIKKRIGLIIAFVIGAAVIAAVLSFFVLTPTYENSSQFLVNQENTGQQGQQFTSTDIRTNVELINTYNVIITSPVILEDVATELDLDMSSTELANKIQVQSAEQSQVVTVTATDEDPQLAMDIANTTVQIFQDKIPEIMSVDNVTILSEAELSENPSPVAPNPMLNIAIAIVLGGMIGVGLAFLLSYMDNTIKTEEDIEKLLEVPVLGVITHIEDKDIRMEQPRQIPNKARRRDFDGAQKESV